MSTGESDITGPTPGEAALRKLNTQAARIKALEDERDAAEARTDRLEAIIEDQQATIERLLERTDAMSILESRQDGGLDAETRRAMLLNHLHKKSENKHDAGKEQPNLVKISSEEWERFLDYPDLDRSTFTKDLSRAARRVDWDGLSYADGVLRADFGVSIPETVAVTRSTGGDGS